MPFTPFHFGVGLGLKGITAPVFSWSAFCATQVLIDCETLYHLLRHEYPVHRFFHSFLGAALAGSVVSGGLLLVVGALRRARPTLGPARWQRVPVLSGELSAPGVWVGGAVGGLSHPLLDGLMHRDVQPFMPWSSWNPMLGAVAVGTLHQVCLAAAALGTVGVALWMRSKQYQAG